MSATLSNLGPLSLGESAGESAGGFGPHVEELQAFFGTRAMGFGSVGDLKPFVDRLDGDASFADEMASMVRTIIYRERDGLSRLELIELIETAVAGPEMDDATAPEVREAVRGLMVFVESVFRARRNPGAVSDAGGGHASALEPERQEHKAAEVAVEAPGQEAEAVVAVEPAPAAHATTDVFYRARMAAEEEEAGTRAEDRTAKATEERTAEAEEERRVGDDAVEPETVLNMDPHTDLHWHVPFEDFEERETSERGSKAWLWVAGMCALLLAFCAGLFVHQRLIVPLRAPNTPYEKLPPEMAEDANGASTTPAVAGRAQSTGADNADNIVAGSMVVHAAVARPSVAGGPGSEANVRPRYMAPATIGASAASMASRLVYAPPPAYPMVAEMTRIQGKVTVEAVVGKDGRVIRAQAVGGHHLLRGAAVREVYRRRYRPYTLNDRPTNVATMVTVDFRLKR